jgi:pyruvate dehydrogenase complex dehydrogenase (E1) component
LAALFALCEEGEIERGQVTEAIRKYEIDPNKTEPSAP